MDKELEICKAENGYVVKCCVPIKPGKTKSAEDVMGMYPGSGEKKYVAKDFSEVSDIVKKILPLLDEEFTSEDEFDAAFEKAAK